VEISCGRSCIIIKRTSERLDQGGFFGMVNFYFEIALLSTSWMLSDLSVLSVL